MDRCLNINNQKVIELSKQLGLSPASTAAKIVVWQETNGNKIPTLNELKEFDIKNKSTINQAIVLNSETKWLYEKYNLLAKDGKIKDVSKMNKEKLKEWVDTLNLSPYFTFKSRNTTGGTKILIFPKETEKEIFWNELKPETQNILSSKGITETIYNNLSADEKRNLINCHGK